MKKELKVATPKGVLKAAPSKDPEYPGIFILLETEDGITEQIALVECEPEKGIRTVAWELSGEDYIVEAVWQE